MTRIIFFIAAIICSQTLKAQTYSGTLLSTDPTFNRTLSGEPPTSLSGAATAVYYHVLSVPITLAGVYTFSALSVFDNWGILYSPAGFDPLNPLDNAIEADDDGAGGFDFAISEFLSIGTYYLVVTTYSDGELGDYTITTTGPEVVALPMKLLHFKVTKNLNGTGAISWTTTQEEGIKHYEVEKSLDGSNYLAVYKMLPTGDGSQFEHNYAIPETPLDHGNNIFRLKIVEQNGKTTYSNNKIITENKEAHILLYPNPATESIHFSILSGEEMPISISIHDFTGKVHAHAETMGKKGKNLIKINIENLPAGNYIFRYTAENSQKTIKFIKQ